ncbi:hypothetical protein Yalta_034 [Yalta virus]|nr:hypothetical protein Yalta_034 [Yalta virus]
MATPTENLIPSIQNALFIVSPENEANEEREVVTRRKSWYKKISVEPIVFFFSLSYYLLENAKKVMLFDKICKIDLNYTNEVCDVLNEYHNQSLYEKIIFNVEKEVVDIITTEEKCITICSLILAYFMGAFSDIYGRKIFILVGLIGKLFYSFVLILISFIPCSSKYFLITGTVPVSVIGYNLAIFIGCYSYLADITTVKERTIRISILEGFRILSVPLAYVLNNYAFTYSTPLSYIKTFSFDFVLTFLFIIYAMLLLKPQSNTSQKPLSEAKNHLFFEFFNLKHLLSIDKVLNVNKNKRNVVIKTTVILFLLYKMQAVEEFYLNKYALKNFLWDIENDVIFQIIIFSIMTFSVLVLLPFMIKILGFSNTTIWFIGIYFYIIARCLYVYNTTTLYIGEIIYSLAFFTYPIILSNISKTVNKSEQGRIFAFLHACALTSLLLGDLLYEAIFKATDNIDKKRGHGIFSVSLLNHIISLGICFALCYIKTKIQNMKRRKIIILSAVRTK